MGNALPVNDVTVKHCFCSYHPVEKYGKKNEKQAKNPYLRYISNKKELHYNVLR